MSAQPALPLGLAACPNCRTRLPDAGRVFGCDHCRRPICDDCALPAADECALRHCWACVSDDGECKGVKRGR